MARSSTRAVARVAGVDVSTDHYIGGRRVASPERFADHSPIDWAPLAQVARGGAPRGRRSPSTPRATRSPPGPRSGLPAARPTCDGSPT